MSVSVENVLKNENEINETITNLRNAYKKKKLYRFTKRCFDFLIALILMLILWPFLLLIAFLIVMDSPGPALFKQERIGRKGKVFVIYKFRTMRQDAPDSIAADQFIDSDKYITKLGAFLRRTSIDELPQLINVLKGEMSLVGYRPLCLTEVKCNRLRNQYGVFLMRPGITGLAQVSGRDNIPYKEKAAIDAEYVINCGIGMDFMCLVKTIKIVLTGEGIR